jgi:hypothetical protein
MGTAKAREANFNKAEGEGVSHPAIFAAMSAIMGEIGPIGKDKTNEQQRFKFRGIDDIYNNVSAVMAKHKVFTVPEVIAEKSEERQSKNGGNLIYRILTIKYRFYAVDGSSVEATVIGEGMDSGDKAANKAMSIAHKYTLLQAFCIATQDIEDPDKTVHETAPKPRPVVTPRPTSPSIYDGSESQQKIVMSILKSKKVPEEFWEMINDRMLGQPSTALNGVIDDVRLGL